MYDVVCLLYLRPPAVLNLDTKFSTSTTVYICWQIYISNIRSIPLSRDLQIQRGTAVPRYCTRVQIYNILYSCTAAVRPYQNNDSRVQNLTNLAQAEKPGNSELIKQPGCSPLLNLVCVQSCLWSQNWVSISNGRVRKRNLNAIFCNISVRRKIYNKKYFTYKMRYKPVFMQVVLAYILFSFLTVCAGTALLGLYESEIFFKKRPEDYPEVQVIGMHKTYEID